MPFTPKAWVNYPPTADNARWDAAAAIDLETRVTNYTDSVVGGSFTSTGPITVGSGDAITFYNATTAQNLIVRRGTEASPDTNLHPALKVERFLNPTGISGDGVEQCAAIIGIAKAASTSVVQPVGVAGFAINSSTSSGGSGFPDACGLYGGGRILNPGSGTAIGSFLVGRNDSQSGRACTLELHCRNDLGSDPTLNTIGFQQSQALWMNAGGPNKSVAGIVFGNAFSQQFLHGIYFNAQVTGGFTGGVATSSIRDDSTSTIGIDINGTHSTAAMTIAEGSGPLLIGRDTLNQSTNLLELWTTTNRSPIASFRGSTGTTTLHIEVGNGFGAAQYFVSGATNNYITGTAAGDTGIRMLSANRKFIIGGSTPVLTFTYDNLFGAFAATPVGRQTVSGSRGANAALASLLTAMANLGWITDSTSA